MPEGRPAIPRPLKRALMEEAGYRCAVPTCQQTTALEYAHIVPWSEVQTHDFDNMLVLCAIDHYRYDNGEIPRASIYNYKRNLAVVNARYNDFERRVLEQFHDEGVDQVIALENSSGIKINVRNLLRDGLITAAPTTGVMTTYQMPNGGLVMQMPVASTNSLPDTPLLSMEGAERVGGTDDYRLTQAGVEFVRRWFGAEEVAPDLEE